MPSTVDVAAPTTVCLRPASQTDDAFLRCLLLDARPELRLLAPDLAELQFAAQRAQYRAEHPDSIDEIIEVAGEPVGRCWTSTTAADLHLLDLAVCAPHRRAGIGRAVVELVARRAAAAGLVVRLRVWSGNRDARRLYRAIGFDEAGAAGGYLHLHLDPRRVR